MNHAMQFYIGGHWVDPAVPAALDVIDPSTEQPFTKVSLGSKADVDRAVAAARPAFEAFSQTTREERLALLRNILDSYNSRTEELVEAVSLEMGAPLPFAREAQVWAGRVHLEATIEALESYEFSRTRGTSLIVREAVGVAALITPWNWPLNQIVCKVAPALAAGCAVVLKPSEIAPVSGILFAEIVQSAGAPPGVFNLVNGTGPDVGQVMAAHPDVDMVSFTGSTRAGIIVAKAAADTVKRVAQELGGKSPNIILPDADLPAAVRAGVIACFSNSGQSCDAPTRMLVPSDAAGRGARDRRRSRVRAEGRPSARARGRSGAGRQPDAVRQDPAPDRGRDSGGGEARRRGPWTPSGAQSGILRPPDRLRRR